MGNATTEETERWQAICSDFLRQRKAGGEDVDGFTRIANALLDVSRAVDDLKPGDSAGDSEAKRMADAVLQIAVTYRSLISPLIAATEKRMDLDHSLSKHLEQLLAKASAPQTVRPDRGVGKKPERSAG